MWRELLLAAIGEQFLDDDDEGEEDADEVCGLSVSPRERDDLIQVIMILNHVTFNEPLS